MAATIIDEVKGWKAFRTADGRTSNPRDESGNFKPDHETSVRFPLNQTVHKQGKWPFWFCESETHARAWAERLGYAYIAPVVALQACPPRPSKMHPADHPEANKWTAETLTRVGEMQPSGASINNIAYTAYVFRDQDQISENILMPKGTWTESEYEVWTSIVRCAIGVHISHCDSEKLTAFANAITPANFAQMFVPEDLLMCLPVGNQNKCVETINTLRNICVTQEHGAKVWSPSEQSFTFYMLFVRCCDLGDLPMLKWIQEFYPQTKDVAVEGVKAATTRMEYFCERERNLSCEEEMDRVNNLKAVCRWLKETFRIDDLGSGDESE